jgi:hypothetical protein
MEYGSPDPSKRLELTSKYGNEKSFLDLFTCRCLWRPERWGDWLEKFWQENTIDIEHLSYPGKV